MAAAIASEDTSPDASAGGASPTDDMGAFWSEGQKIEVPPLGAKKGICERRAKTFPCLGCAQRSHQQTSPYNARHASRSAR
jgi:hypothetical protein